jgi:hypothetical protein
MSISLVQEQLLDAGLHEESVERLLEHYQDMRFRLGNREYIDAGAHIGNFCENLVNLILAETNQGAQARPSAGNFVDNILNGNYDTSDLAYEIRVTIPRAMRVAYDLRNNRDSVHINLDVPVNHSDTQTAVRLCTWMLTELLRVYGDENHVDEIADLIEELADPVTPYVDSYEGKRLVMHMELELEQELLVHLHTLGREVSADKLSEWLPEGNPHRVKSKLGNMKQSRKVHYEDGMAKITPIGVEEAEEIIEEYFESGIPELSRHAEQQLE